MKKISGLILMIITAFGVLLSACSKSDDAMMEGLQLQSPYDTQWKLIAFGEATQSNFSVMTANSVKKAISPDAADAYQITFKRDSTFTGSSSTNAISGKISIDEKRGTITLKEIIGTEKAEIGNGTDYMSALSKVTQYTVIYKDKEMFLRLFYPEEKRYYLEYKALAIK